MDDVSNYIVTSPNYIVLVFHLKEKNNFFVALALDMVIVLLKTEIWGCFDIN